MTGATHAGAGGGADVRAHEEGAHGSAAGSVAGSGARVDAAQLRTLFLFEALTDEQLGWLAERGGSRTYDGGAPVYREGEPSQHLYVLLEGGLRMSRLVGGEHVTVIETTHRGSYCGAVRAYVEDGGERYQNSVTATVPSRFFQLPAADFADLMRTFFPMAVHLLDGLFIGVRNSEATVRQREHLAQLGTLSANLAHELNNPAAAAVRATGQLRQRVAGMRHKLSVVAEGGVDPATIARLVELQEQAIEIAAAPRAPLSPVEQADLEDEMSDLLEEVGVTGAFELAPVFAAAGLDVAWLREVCAQGDPTGPLRWLADTLDSEGLMDEIEDATGRISTLVAAVKQYSYLDAASHQEVDVHAGLDSTVVMLGSKLQGVAVLREYDRSLPPLQAYGAELNQVWTNLIDNAADAMGGAGTLTLRTSPDAGGVLVEVGDDGPGIPPEVQGRVFDAFFTTKPPGSGSGLGLDNAQRIVVRRHGGTLSFVTGPGGTTFRVHLPLTRAVS